MGVRELAHAKSADSAVLRVSLKSYGRLALSALEEACDSLHSPGLVTVMDRTEGRLQR